MQPKNDISAHLDPQGANRYEKARSHHQCAGPLLKDRDLLPTEQMRFNLDMTTVSHKSRSCTPLDNVLEQLDAVRSLGGPQYIARCPSHNDGRPSLSIREGDDHRVLLKCFAGCDVSDITAALGLSFSDLYPPSTPEQRRKARRIANRRQVLDEIVSEATVVQVIATDVKESREIDLETWNRLAEAARRIHRAREQLR